MSRLVRLFVERYVASISLFGSIVLFGLVAYIGLGIDLFPEIEIPVVAVSTVYPGAGSEEIARGVSEPIEGALATLPGINNVTSTSFEGFSVVVAEFSADVKVDQAAIDVSQRINSVISTLPDDAGTPTIQKFDPNEEPILNIAVSAPGEALSTVQSYVEDELLPELRRAEGVADVSIVGPAEREVQVLLDPGLLEAYGLTPSGVVGAISSSALDLPFGDLTFTGSRVLLTGRNTPETLAEVERILLDSTRGVRVVDVATVRDASADVNAYTRVDGEPVVLLEARKVSGGNSVAAAHSVRNALEALELPAGFQTQVVNDTTLETEATVEDTIFETAIAIVAVALVIMFFVGRLGTILAVVLSIPISITGAFIVFGLMGFTFNLITLLAITVAVGLVVDDSIVVAENIDRYMAMGYARKDAVIQGAGEVSGAVLAATLSLLAVFLPISFLPGIIGDFFAQFGISMSAMIFFSYLASMFFLTMIMAYLPNPLPPSWQDLSSAARAFRGDVRWTLSLWRRGWFWVLAGALGFALYRAFGPMALTGLLALPVALLLTGYLGRLVLFFLGAVFLSVFRAGEWGTNVVRDAYAASLSRLLGHSWLILAGAALLLSSLAFVFPRLGFNFTPPSDSGTLSISLELPTGTSLDRTNLVASRIENQLLRDPLITTVQVAVGSGGAGDGAILGGSSVELASITAELSPERDQTTPKLAPVYETRLRELLSDIPEASLRVAADQGGAPTRSGYELNLASNDPYALRARKSEIRAVLEESPYLRNIESSLGATVSERVFVLNEAALTGTGVTPATLYGALRTYNVGTEAATLRANGDERPIVVRANPRFVADEQALLGLPISAPGLGSELPIGAFGRFQTRDAPAIIDRSNRSYALDFTADLVPGAPDLFSIRQEIEGVLLGDGLIGDRVRLSSATGLDLLGDLVTYGPIAFALALLLNYLVIGTQFNPFKFPLYLLLTVPLALVGAFWLLYFTNTSLDVISVLGVIMLIGLVTKNAILLLEVIMERVREGGGRVESLKGALVEAARLRFRPIVMTALTVVIISLPLLLGLGEGSEFRLPLGLVILGGVLTSALLTFYVVPAAFYLFERKNLEGGGREGREERVQERVPKRKPAPVPRSAPQPQAARSEA